MNEIILFGGTSEGRSLCELLSKKQVETLVCVATGYGKALLEPSRTLRIHTGRLDRKSMENLFQNEKPRLIIDATHPYASEVSDTIRTVCDKYGIALLRVLRETLDTEDCVMFDHMDKLTSWLSEQSGTIFSTLGAKEHRCELKRINARNKPFGDVFSALKIYKQQIFV